MNRQEAEMLALTSIYEEPLFTVDKNSESGLYSGCLACHYKLESPYLLTVRDESGGDKSACVNYLPPVHLYFTLPADYPSPGKPKFTLACSWLKPSQLIAVRDKLKNLQMENIDSEILFLWFCYLKDELLQALDISVTIDLSLVAKESEVFLRKVAQDPELTEGIDVSLASAIDRLQLCENFDMQQENADLLSVQFTCGICLFDRIGKNTAIVKPCRHLFCRSCISDYFKSKIKEGKVQDITCPADGCGTIVNAALIRSALDEKSFQRYDALMLRASLNAIGDLVYCPRTSCQYPVIFDQGTSSATCPSCNGTFCVYCRRTYHGVAPCRFGADEIESLRTKFLAGDEGEKKKLEERYGRMAIKQAIDEFDSASFLKDNCRQCPHCHAWCQKIEGCNKMACSKCHCYFCWLCNKILSRTDPYAHFSDVEGGCAGRLFEGLNRMVEEDDEEEASDEEGDDDDDEWTEPSDDESEEEDE